MSFHTSTEFQAMRAELGGLLVKTAAEYAKNKGLARLDQARLTQMSANIEDIACELLMFGADTWPESARAEEIVHPFEISASETDPPIRPWFWTALAGAIALILSGALYATFGMGDYWAMLLGTVGIAMTFGSSYALINTTLSYLLHNLFVIEPTLAFTWPTKTETMMGIGTITFALVLPWLTRQTPKWRSRLLTKSPFNGLAFERSR